MREEAFRVFGFIAFGIVITLGLLAVVQMLSVSPLWNEGGAAWVQAIGSIAAIAGAFFIANRQHVTGRMLEQERRHHEEIRRFSITLSLVKQANEILLSLKNARENKGPCCIGAKTLALLNESIAAIASVPPFELPDGPLIMGFLLIPRAMQDLHGVLKDANERGNVEAREIEEIDVFFAFAIDLTSAASIICEKEIASRRTPLRSARL